MEKLHVEDFLVIKKAELDLRRFCVIIGPQASGKSVLAKLVHLFREFFDESTRKVLLETKDGQEVNRKDRLCGLLKDSFSNYFPGFPDDGRAFRVVYSAVDFSVRVDGDGMALQNGQFNVEFSDAYLEFLESTSREFAKSRKLLLNESPASLKDIDDRLTLLLDTSPVTTPFRSARKNSAFIPASRAFFSTLQKHVFSMLKLGISFDPLMISFGSRFEASKNSYEREASGLFTVTEPLVQSILVGKYRFREGEDWIQGPDGEVKLQHASSGQQEALPMLLVLTVWGSYVPKGFGFIIEEPEAHLYPKAQKDIVSLFGLISNQRQLDFFITTHSPYILAALNNLILAGEVKQAAGAEALEAVVDPETSLSFSDVSAYTLTDGVLHSILDEEERLIGVNAIDGVSDDFSDEFEALLELREAGGRGAYTG